MTWYAITATRRKTDMPTFEFKGLVASSATATIEADTRDAAIQIMKNEGPDYENIDEFDFSHFEWDGEVDTVENLDEEESTDDA
jgi:hypothetical protein